MSDIDVSTEEHDEPRLTEIRIKGHLDKRWADWFAGLTITLEENGETRLTGPVVDQAALHGLLKKVRDWACPWSRSCTLMPNRPLGRLSTLIPDDYRSQKWYGMDKRAQRHPEGRLSYFAQNCHPDDHDP